MANRLFVPGDGTPFHCPYTGIYSILVYHCWYPGIPLLVYLYTIMRYTNIVDIPTLVHQCWYTDISLSLYCCREGNTSDYGISVALTMSDGVNRVTHPVTEQTQGYLT